MYKKQLAVATCLLGILLFQALLGVAPVYAQEADYCAPGTGVKGVPCEPCDPGPYNICIPRTNFAEVSRQFLNQIQADEQTQTTIVYISAGLGVFFLVNGISLYKRTL